MTRLFRATAPPLLAALLFSTAVTSHNRVSTRLSWDGDISRVVDARCVSCHRAAPVDLSGYATARPWARAMREAMLEGHGYSAGNGAALTPFERELLVQWIDGGAPERPKFFPVDYSRLPATFIRIASPDPLAALDAHHAARGGTRAIIAGLGLALRTPEEILVFERGAGPAERVIARGTIVPSIAAHLAALPASTARTRVSDAAYIIGAPGELRVEAAEVAPEGPDRFWCPMHPDVRSSGPGVCSRCAMTLVEIPAMSLDSFSLAVAGMKIAAGGELELCLRVARSKNPVTAFLTTHERPFHLFVVDERLRFFAHVHPDVNGDTLTARVTLPAAGRYRLVGEFAPIDALPQVRMVPFDVRRSAEGAVREQPATMTGSLEAVVAKAGQQTRLTFALRDVQTGRSPERLEPYLGAAAHLFAIDEALRDPIHAHPVEITGAGLGHPAFDVRFPRAGRYVMWLQVQRAGRVETMRFTVDASK